MSIKMDSTMCEMIFMRVFLDPHLSPIFCAKEASFGVRTLSDFLPVMQHLFSIKKRVMSAYIAGVMLLHRGSILKSVAGMRELPTCLKAFRSRWREKARMGVETSS